MTMNQNNLQIPLEYIGNIAGEIPSIDQLTDSMSTSLHNFFANGDNPISAEQMRAGLEFYSGVDMVLDAKHLGGMAFESLFDFNYGAGDLVKDMVAWTATEAVEEFAISTIEEEMDKDTELEDETDLEM